MHTQDLDNLTVTNTVFAKMDLSNSLIAISRYCPTLEYSLLMLIN